MIANKFNFPKRTALFSSIALAFAASTVNADTDILLSDYSVDPGDSLTVQVSLDADIATFGTSYGIELFGPPSTNCVALEAGLDDATATITELIGENFAAPFNENTAVVWTPTTPPVGTSDAFPVFDTGADGCASGVYRIRAIQSDKKNTDANKPDTPESNGFTTFTINPGAVKQDVLLLDGITSRVGNNNYGGKSLHSYNSGVGGGDGVPAGTVEIDRPMKQNLDVLGTAEWLRNQGVAHDAMSMLALNTAPIPDSYKVVIVAGRVEFWTEAMRNALDTYVANGGNVMFLGAESMRYNTTIAGGKMSADTASVAGERSTTDVQASTGLSFSGFVNDGSGFLPASVGDNGAYKVGDATHWVYTGLTGVSNATVFGKTSLIVGPSVDGATITTDATGKANVTMGAPSNYEVIAWSPAKLPGGIDSFATPGLFKNGAGWVFNAATARWVKGLSSQTVGTTGDATVERITSNVIIAFRNGMTDADGDGFPAGVDVDDNDGTKPVDPTDLDPDNDDVDNPDDNCPDTANPNQEDADDDGIGDVCDSTPNGDSTTPTPSTPTPASSGGGVTGLGFILSLFGMNVIRRKRQS